jgi:glycosyltransferase involved in cell wall biosynthesis
MLVHASVIPESFGLVGIEAMAHGVPVVGFDLGGAREWLVDGETGIAATPWSVEELAGGIRRLLLEPALAEKLGRAGQARTRALFTPPRFLADTLTVYEETMAAWREQRGT